MNEWLRLSRTVRSLSFLLIFVCHGLSAQDTVSISDFRYPETRAIDWKGYLSGYFNREDQDNGRFLAPDRFQTGTGSGSYGNFNASSNFLFFHTKDDHDQTFQLQASGSYSHNGNEGIQVDTAVYQSSTGTVSWIGEVDANWIYLHYLTGDGLHLIGALSSSYFAASLKENVARNSGSGSMNWERKSNSHSIHFRGSLGMGFGRLRDGTFVFRALRIIDRLREDGLITRPMSRNEVLGLVNRIAHLREYTTNFERYSKYFVKDIVEELVVMGVITPGSVTPFSSLRILEAFQENVQPRYFGWRAYYLFNDSHDQSRGDASQEESYTLPTTSHTYRNDWDYVHEFGVQIAWPFSLADNVTANGLLDLPNHNVQLRFSFRFDASISHQIGERLEANARYQLFYGVNDPFSYNFNYTSRSVNHTIQGNFVYFLEDQVRFQTGIGYSFSSALSAAYKTSSFNFSFGLMYNII